jgi:hypothetical protein
MKLRLLCAGAALAIAGSASADLYVFTAILSGLNEVPPNGSPATGISMGTYDSGANFFEMDTNASGFVANVTAAHIHVAPPGVAGPVLHPLSGATGSTSFTSHDTRITSTNEENDFLAGLWYVNIHSLEFPGGEVRGQLIPTLVPEPGTVVGLLVGGGLLALLRRRR